MTDKVDDIDELIRSVYNNPDSAGSFGGVERLWNEVRKLNKRINKQRVIDFLSKTPAYTLHRDARRRGYARQATVAPTIDYQWQADLVILFDIAKHNDGYNYLLTCIDVFSKFAWARPLKAKTGSEVTAAFKDIFERSGRKPIKLNTDEGTEFLNKPFQTFLRERGVQFFSSVGDLKAAVCERFNRTLKARMWRYFTTNNTYRYVDVLQRLIQSYNNSVHRTIGVAPSQVTERNQDLIRKRVEKAREKLYGKTVNKRRKQKLKFFVNQPVRVNSQRHVFAKAYAGTWSEEIFFIDKIYDSNDGPLMYRLRDSTGGRIKGRFYQEEIQVVREPTGETAYVIERIVARRTRRGHQPEVLVKWRGYPESANTWEPASAIKDI